MTCYDLRFPELARALVERGADVLVVPAAWVAGDRKVDHWRTLVRARAIENTAYVVAAAQPGPRYTGHSMVVDPRGDVLVEAGDGDEVITAVLEREVARGGATDQPVAGQPPNVTFTVVSSPAPGATCCAPAVAQQAAGSDRSPGLGRRAAPGGALVPRRCSPGWPRSGVATAGLTPEPYHDEHVSRGGAVAIAAAYSWALAARTGGRPMRLRGPRPAARRRP